MVLLGMLSDVGRLLKLTGTDIDSPICKLHHKFTTTILFAFCLLMTATNLIGDPVTCTFSDHMLMKETFVNTYCWIHTTFTLPRHFKGSSSSSSSSSSSMYPGVGAHTSKDEKIYHAYYQWVPFILFLQGLLFYAPYWLWKTCEGGKMEAISEDLTQPIMNREERKDKVEMLAEYLHASLHQHNFYAIKYLLCEILNFIITVVNIVLFNKLLGGKFISYGTDVFSFLQMESEDRTDPMHVLFPRMTKCTIKAIGPSGTRQNLDALCVLPHNIVNEKLYIILWVWMWFLVVADSLAILWRVIVLFVPFVRLNLLKNYTQGLNNNQMNILSINLQVGDYFLIYLLHKNVSQMSFTDLIREVTERIAGKTTNTLEMGEKAATDTNGYCLMNEHKR